MNIQSFGDVKAEGITSDEIVHNALATVFRRSMFWRPEREVPSAWIEHVPFAFWLVDVLRPRRIVELGTHNGVSYSSMCQTVKTLGLATSCFAVDTWKGDEHAGFYGEEVYRDFAAFHDQRYGAFSVLVRSTFDEALRHFEDGAIDLLHIDALHTYEAVRHDYESWLPKLAANAVVLFHDTNVRERDFGVFRLWNEITAGKPHFDFLHGYGLGVLGHGQQYPDALCALFNAGEDDRVASAIRQIFAGLGRSVRILSERAQLERSLSERASEIGRLQEALAVRDDELGNVEQRLSEDVSEIGTLMQAVAAREDDIARLHQELSERARETENLRGTLAAQDERIEEFTSRNALLNQILASNSWRMTRPLRVAGRLLRGEWSLVLPGLRASLLRLVRSIYRWLPLSSVNKQKFASSAFRVAGPLFKGVPSYELWRAGRWTATRCCRRTTGRG